MQNYNKMQFQCLRVFVAKRSSISIEYIRQIHLNLKKQSQSVILFLYLGGTAGQVLLV